jgi:hypothetical protein
MILRLRASGTGSTNGGSVRTCVAYGVLNFRSCHTRASSRERSKYIEMRLDSCSVMIRTPAQTPILLQREVIPRKPLHPLLPGLPYGLERHVFRFAYRSFRRQLSSLKIHMQIFILACRLRRQSSMPNRVLHQQRRASKSLHHFPCRAERSDRISS